MRADRERILPQRMLLDRQVICTCHTVARSCCQLVVHAVLLTRSLTATTDPALLRLLQERSGAQAPAAGLGSATPTPLGTARAAQTAVSVAG